MRCALQYVSDGIHYGRIKIDGKVIPTPSTGCPCRRWIRLAAYSRTDLHIKE